MHSFICVASRAIAVIVLLLISGLFGPKIYSQHLSHGDSKKVGTPPSASQVKLLFSVISLLYDPDNYVPIKVQEEADKDKSSTQSQQQETPAAREKRLIERLEKVKARLMALQLELNELRLRVLQNRPRNPLVFGDPYYVDPKMREQIAKLRRQLLETQLEFENLVNELEGR